MSDFLLVGALIGLIFAAAALVVAFAAAFLETLEEDDR